MKLLVKLFTKTVKGRYRVRWKSFGSLRVHDKNYWKYRSIYHLAYVFKPPLTDSFSY